MMTLLREKVFWKNKPFYPMAKETKLIRLPFLEKTAFDGSGFSPVPTLDFI